MVDTITDRSIDFTNRDFDSWIIELRKRASQGFPGWTEFNTPNFGNILLEMYAHTLDVLSYTQDSQHLERYVSYARLLRSMINLGKNVGFSLPQASPSTTDLEITIADGQPRTTAIVIPQGTIFTTEDLTENIEFDLTADVTITAGAIQITNASVENARARSIDFVADGSVNQQVILPEVPYVDQTASVVVGATTYTEVDNFLSSGVSDNHFIVDVNENGLATVKFGDGVNGTTPSGAATITYKTGGGSSGNVDANTIVAFLNSNTFIANNGEAVQLTVRNPNAVSDGVDAMTVEEARIAIPAHVRTAGGRSVTREDFEDNAKRVRGVARVLMLSADEDPSIPSGEGRIYIIPVGGGLPSTALKNSVLTLINNDYPPCIGFTVSVLDPTILIISIQATVYLSNNVTETEARTAIESSVDSFFSLLNSDGSQNSQIDFGYNIRANTMPPGTLTAELPWSDIFNSVRDATTDAGVRVCRKVDEDVFIPVNDVPVADIEFPVVGSIILTNGDTGLTF